MVFGTNWWWVPKQPLWFPLWQRREQNAKKNQSFYLLHFLIEEVHKEIGDSEKSLLAELVIMTLTAINSLLRSPNRYTPPTASLQAVVRPLLQNKENMWLMNLYNISLMVLKTRTIDRKTYLCRNKRPQTIYFCSLFDAFWLHLQLCIAITFCILKFNR